MRYVLPLPLFWHLTVRYVYIWPRIICKREQTQQGAKVPYDMIYLTAIGLKPGGSSTVHIYTNNT